MEHTEELSLEQIRAFLQASQEVRFEATRREEGLWMGDTDAVSPGVLETEARGQGSAPAVHRQDDRTEPGAGDPVDRAIPERRAGEGAELPAQPVPTPLHRADLELLGAVDEAHEKLSGPATQKILYREFYEYGEEQYRQAGQHLGAAYLQSAKEPGLPQEANRVSKD